MVKMIEAVLIFPLKAMFYLVHGLDYVVNKKERDYAFRENYAKKWRGKNYVEEPGY